MPDTRWDSLGQFHVPVEFFIMKVSKSLCALVLAAVGSASGDKPVYKDPEAAIDDRVSDLLGRMSPKEKMAQLIQGDMTNYLNLTDGTVNKTGLEWNMEYRANSVWTGLYAEMETVKKAAKLAQDYMVNETELGELVECLCTRARATNDT